ncbi:MAG: UbiA family prenyltransferase [bacterium]|nr:MAG: UbiA family prenyltransferase [bacterium]
MSNNIYPIPNLNFWKAYWITMRPYLLFISGVAGMVGFAVGAERGIMPTIGAFVAFLFAYGFGQALTDCFQIDTDSISSPYRPLVQGVITKKQVLSVSLGGLLGCCFILFFLNPCTLILGVLCVFGLATYTYFKRRWWAGPFYNAWIVALLPIIGKMTTMNTNNSLSAMFENGILFPIVISIFFSYANFVLMGYFKDILADRASGYHTFVVAYGWKKAAIGSDIFALASVLATGWAISNVLLNEMVFSSQWISIPIFFAAIFALLSAQIGIHRINDEKKAHKPISNVVRGFILLHLAEICLIRPTWFIFSILFYIIFELTLKIRPEKGQV